MSTIRAVVVDPAAPARLALREVPAPVPGTHEALVRVQATSLNRGEARGTQMSDTGWRPGWDFAGVVEQAATDGSGPVVGARVVGFLRSGAWAELVATPAVLLAEVPEGVSQAEAATLPIAGLSALYALERAGSLLGRRVLVTGATGGVGLFACQLARDAGAHVTALVRRTEQAEEVRAAGAHEVAVGRGSDAAALGPFDAIVDSVGGEVLGATMGALAYGGVCVSLGATEAREATFDVGRFFSSGGRMDGFLIFNEVGRRPIAADLGRLLAMVAAGRLKTSIAREAPWAEVGLLVQELLDRRFTGKAVLHVGG